MVGGKIVSTEDAWGHDFKDSWPCIEAYYEWLKPFIAEFVRVLKDNGSLILFLDRKYTGLIAHYIERDFHLNFKNKIYFKKKTLFQVLAGITGPPSKKPCGLRKANSTPSTSVSSPK